jgi:hypothetical protein
MTCGLERFSMLDFSQHDWDRGAGTCTAIYSFTAPQVGSPIFFEGSISGGYYGPSTLTAPGLETRFRSIRWTILTWNCLLASSAEWPLGCCGTDVRDPSRFTAKSHWRP